MHLDAIISTVIAVGTGTLGFSGMAGAATDVAVLSSMVFASIAGWDLIGACLRR